MTLSLISLEAYVSVLVRLVIALLCGALIGMERGSTKHDAGLRTHIIVCLGAAAVMITSQLILERYGSITDITRLGAQVISGIGFLGAGSIIVNRNRVHGLTTAAGLWTTACLGLVVGAGFIEVSLTILFLIMFTTYVLRPLSLKLRSNDLSFQVTADAEKLGATEITKFFAEKGYEISSLKITDRKIIVILHMPNPIDKNAFIMSTVEIPGILSISEI
ncbi:MAG: MgtC/SapB family protein [Oscillospiraceae bacterium]|nr:MgtC/SapB family protein [Oscillospiraceae bacterium]